MRTDREQGGDELLEGDVLWRKLCVDEPPTHHALDAPVVREGPRTIRGRARHGDRVRRVPQHREDRGARGRREAREGARASQGRDAGVPRGPSGNAREVPGRRPAGPHPGGHGLVLLRPRGPPDVDGEFVRVLVSWRGPSDVAEGRGAEVQGERSAAGARAKGHLPPRSDPGRDRRGGAGRVQERRGRRARRGGRRPHEDRRPHGPPRGREGVKVRLLPVGEVPQGLLPQLSGRLARFGIRGEVLGQIAVPGRARRGIRGPLRAEALVRLAAGRGAAVLAVTAEDLCAEGYEYVFGYANIG